MVGIYKIVNPKGRTYIGQSNDIQLRRNGYKNYGAPGQPALNRSLKKYGFEKHKFEVVEECEIEKLNDRERFWQEKYNVLSENGLNCCLVSTEYKKYVHSKDTRRKMRKRMLGTKLSLETRLKMGKKHKGKVTSEETKNKIREAKLGTKHTPEARAKMSKSHMGYKQPASVREKIGEASKKKIKVTATGEVYNSVMEYRDSKKLNYYQYRKNLKEGSILFI